MTLDYQLIGKRIKEERKKHHLTQENMAEKIGTSVTFYSRLESGKSHINLKNLFIISDALGVSAGYFISGIEEEKEDYMSKEFRDILSKCTVEQQKFIYKVAELVVENLGWKNSK